MHSKYTQQVFAGDRTACFFAEHRESLVDGLLARHMWRSAYNVAWQLEVTSLVTSNTIILINNGACLVKVQIWSGLGSNPLSLKNGDGQHCKLSWTKIAQAQHTLLLPYSGFLQFTHVPFIPCTLDKKSEESAPKHPPLSLAERVETSKRPFVARIHDVCISQPQSEKKKIITNKTTINWILLN